MRVIAIVCNKVELTKCKGKDIECSQNLVSKFATFDETLAFHNNNYKLRVMTNLYLKLQNMFINNCMINPNIKLHSHFDIFTLFMHRSENQVKNFFNNNNM